MSIKCKLFLVRLYQGGHSAANAVKAVKMVDFEREAVVAVKCYTFSMILRQKLHYCLVPIYIYFSISLKMVSLECCKVIW